MDPFQSIKLLSRELLDRGYTYKKVSKNGKSYRYYQKGLKTWTTPFGFVHYPFVSDEIKRLAKDKRLAYEYIADRGFSIPRSVYVRVASNFHPTSFSGLKRPVVVKPVDGSGSILVTRNARTNKEIERAIESIHEIGHDAIAQEQFKGKELRFTVIEGQVASVILRQVPRVVGDGVSDIQTLLADENISRQNIDVPYIDYPQLTSEQMNSLTDQGRVLADGEVAQLGQSTLISGGASVYNVIDDVHVSYRDLVSAMVSDLNAPFLTVDILVTDYEQPVTTDSYVFLEFNTAPALKLYYSFRGGNQYNIVPKLADMIDRYA